MTAIYYDKNLIDHDKKIVVIFLFTKRSSFFIQNKFVSGSVLDGKRTCLKLKRHFFDMSKNDMSF